MATCGYCKHKDGTHSERCKKRRCKLCARLAPDRCARHGGPSHSTEHRGKGRIHGVPTAATGLVAEIARLKAVAAAGRAAELDFERVRKLLAQ